MTGNILRQESQCYKKAFRIYFSWSETTTKCTFRAGSGNFSDKLRFGEVGAALLETDEPLIKKGAEKRIALKAFLISDILGPEFCL